MLPQRCNGDHENVMRDLRIQSMHPIKFGSDGLFHSETISIRISTGVAWHTTESCRTNLKFTVVPPAADMSHFETSTNLDASLSRQGYKMKYAKMKTIFLK